MEMVARMGVVTGKGLSDLIPSGSGDANPVGDDLPLHRQCDHDGRGNSTGIAAAAALLFPFSGDLAR